jgi:aromatic ring hydroxylase-like protein
LAARAFRWPRHSVPDFELVDGRKIGEFFRTGKGLFLDFNAGAPLETLSGRWGDRIIHIASDVKDRLGLSASLMRPDIAR